MEGWDEKEFWNKDLMAPCGLYCGTCGVFIATRDGNEKFKSVMGKLFLIENMGVGIIKGGVVIINNAHHAVFSAKCITEIDTDILSRKFYGPAIKILTIKNTDPLIFLCI